MILRTTSVAMLASLALTAALTACSSSDSSLTPQTPPNRPTGTSQGSVTSSVDGAPISNAIVIVRSEVGAASGTQDNATFTFGIQTNADGTFVAPKTPVGLLTAIARAPGYQTSSPVQFALATDGTAQFHFVLSPGQGSKPNGEAFDPNTNPDGQIHFPFDYDGNFLSYRPKDN